MMKTYVLMVSERFPQTHKRKGELTYFPTKIKNGEKIHTIRANYELWEKRINDIKNGLARLSVRVWESKPYKSKQIQIFEFIAERGIDIQKLEVPSNFVFAPVNGKMINWEEIAKNDGLYWKFFDGKIGKLFVDYLKKNGYMMVLILLKKVLRLTLFLIQIR